MEYTAPGATRPLYADFLDLAGRADAAALFRESARGWERVASLALETVSGLGAYTEICEQRMQLIMSRGEEARAEIRTLGERATRSPRSTEHPTPNSVGTCSTSSPASSTPAQLQAAELL
ncbi:hypothetical protein ACFQ69_36505 [Streptomyces sp. NPDC056470]|uniref:hypothetical protein n=1 Tax=Streptomyces sp. NPDC056470 TaxID=3345831 RepID=UPI003691386D